MASKSRVARVATTALAALACVQTCVADLMCTQFGSNTFRVGSTLKFQWNDTQSTTIEGFSLNLYCNENSKLIMSNIVPGLSTLTSTSPVSWVVPSDIATHSSECQLNQYYGAFVWPSTDPETGVSAEGQARCMTLLFISPNNNNNNNGQNEDPQLSSQEPNNDNANLDEDGNIIVSDRTKSIVIGVGCAVGVLVLSGIVGFYVIRYRNKAAAEAAQQRKLREPIHQGPLFPPSSSNSSGRSSPTEKTLHAAAGGGGGGGGSKGGPSGSNSVMTNGSSGLIAPTTAQTARLGQNRYNELASTASTSEHGDQEMSEVYAGGMGGRIGGGGYQGQAQSSYSSSSSSAAAAAAGAGAAPPPQPQTPTSPTSPSLGSRPQTPIAAAHAKMYRPESSAFSPTMTYSSSPLTALAGSGSGSSGDATAAGRGLGSSLLSDRPASVLTSSFIPMEDDEQDRRRKKQQQQQQQQQYELQVQLQQQQQQQQQMQQYMNYGSY